MRIMLVTMDYPPPMGGIQVVAKNLEEDLSAQGHTVYTLNFDGRNSNNYKKLKTSDFYPIEPTRNVYFKLSNILDARKMFKPSGYRDLVFNNLIYREANKARKQFKPDITHLLKPTLYTAVFESTEPFIVSCHGSEVENTFPVRYSLQHATVIHCVSNYVRGLVRLILGSKFRPLQTHVIENSLNLRLFQDQGCGPKQNIITTCCRLVKDKNVDTIIKAIAHLPSNIQKNYQYVIIGDGPQKKHLLNLARELNLKNVVFLGAVNDRTELSEWLCKSRLFVLCPIPFLRDFEIVEEGFGISFIEAQAASVPVIGSSVGGIPEAIGDAGLIVENPSNPEEIAKLIQTLLEDIEMYQQLQRNAKNRVGRYDRQETIKRFENIYSYALDII